MDKVGTGSLDGGFRITSAIEKLVATNDDYHPNNANHSSTLHGNQPKLDTYSNVELSTPSGDSTLSRDTLESPNQVSSAKLVQNTVPSPSKEVPSGIVSQGDKEDDQSPGKGTCTLIKENDLPPMKLTLRNRPRT